jgi:fimbrial isopeptide formation D2 family protein
MNTKKQHQRNNINKNNQIAVITNSVSVSLRFFIQLTSFIEFKKYISLTVLMTVGVIIFCSPLSTQAAFRSFTPRYSNTTTGNIMMIGNTLLSCPLTVSTCDDTRKGKNNLSNNNFNMERVDTDSDTSTNNSSSADLQVPQGSTVLWAGLYVGGISNSAGRTILKLDTPLTPTYELLRSDQDDTNGTIATSEYNEFKDITNYVKAAPQGFYTVSAGALNIGNNYYGGWGIVVVYSNPAEPVRNLVVNDGFLNVAVGTNVDLTLSGFRTSTVGPVKANIGILAYEGDAPGNGDRVLLNNQEVFNTTNPSNNFFNSTITNLNALPTNSSPNYVNTLGIDIDVVNADGKITPGSTTVPLRLTSSNDGYFPAVITTAIEVLAPKIKVNKKMADLNAGSLMIGDIVEFTIDINSVGDDTASNISLSDIVDSSFTYFPESIKVITGSSSGSKTDQINDDQASYNLLNKSVIINLGTGATASLGGSLLPNQSVQMKFQATVNSSVSNGQLLPNKAKVEYRSVPLGENYSVDSNIVSLPVVVLPTKLNGKIYNDLNNNGLQESTELPQSGVIINILNPTTNVIVYTTITDNNGDWSIDVIPGTYKIDVVEPLGKVVTASTDLNTVTAIIYTTVDAGRDGLNDLSDLKITKVPCPILIAGSNCDYLLTVTNVGTGIVRSPIKIIDQLPNRLTFTGFAQSTTNSVWDCKLVNNNVECTSTQPLNPNESSYVIIKTKLPAL